jgi:small subunit ribosomal protein S10
MKANVWEWEELDKATRAGVEIGEGDWSRRREGEVMRKVDEILAGRGYKEGMAAREESGAVLRP